MNGRPSAVLGLIVALALLSVGRAAPPTTAQTEITYLLGFGANSGCEFFRNGSWYDGKKGGSASTLQVRNAGSAGSNQYGPRLYRGGRHQKQLKRPAVSDQVWRP